MIAQAAAAEATMCGAGCRQQQEASIDAGNTTDSAVEEAGSRQRQHKQ